VPNNCNNLEILLLVSSSTIMAMVYPA